MSRINFQGFTSRARTSFTCLSCQKTRRVRTFEVECTVNPFNKNPDGSVKSANEVRQQAKEEAQAALKRFLREPLCARCEGELGFTKRQELFRRRRNG